MITETEARTIAEVYLKEDSADELVITEVRREKFGWLFFFQSKEYVETGDPSEMLAGNAPFLVDMADGSVHSFGTAYPIEEYLGDYEKERLRKEGR
jgi:hypothetical protein